MIITIIIIIKIIIMIIIIIINLSLILRKLHYVHMIKCTLHPKS